MVLPERNSRAAMPLLPHGILLSTPGPLPPPQTYKKVLQAVGNGSCLPLASCFPCNLIGRQAHQNKDGLAALAGTSLRRILRQERRSEWRGGREGERSWVAGERCGGEEGRVYGGHCEWLPGWMDGQTVGWTEHRAEWIRLRTQQLQDWLSVRLQAGPHVWIKLHRLHRFYYGSRNFTAGLAVVPLDIFRFFLFSLFVFLCSFFLSRFLSVFLSFFFVRLFPEISGSQTATGDLQEAAFTVPVAQALTDSLMGFPPCWLVWCWTLGTIAATWSCPLKLEQNLNTVWVGLVLG